MKRITLAIVLLLSWGGAWADLVIRTTTSELRLMQSPCVHGGILGGLKPEWRPKFKKAQAVVAGKLYFACWIETPDDDLNFIVYEDDSDIELPRSAFTLEPGT
jgi:hypothetical protein